MSKTKVKDTTQAEKVVGISEQEVTTEVAEVNLADVLEKMQKEKKKYLRIKKLF
jgi:hypothetical protein